MTSTASLYGALTTVYTPPATCLTNAYGNFYQSDVLPDVTLGSEDISGMIHDECLPPNFNPNRVMVPVGWYSPGVCPSGWKVAKVGTAPNTDLQSAYTSVSFSTSSVSDETTVWCCPSGLSVPSDADYGCEGATISVTLTTCDLTTGESRTSTVNPSLGTIWFSTCSVTGTTVLSAPDGLYYSVAASPIFVKYRPSDIPLLQQAVPTWGSFPGMTPAPPTPQPSASGNSSGGYPTPPPPPPSGLSQGAKIAIGVAVPVGVIALLLGGFLALRWRKTRIARSKPAPAPSRPEHLKPEMGGQGDPFGAPEHREVEMAEPRTEAELETAEPRTELETEEPRMELATERPPRLVEMEQHQRHLENAAELQG